MLEVTQSKCSYWTTTVPLVVSESSPEVLTFTQEYTSVAMT
jgi:hypothetical protein